MRKGGKVRTAELFPRKWIDPFTLKEGGQRGVSPTPANNFGGAGGNIPFDPLNNHKYTNFIYVPFILFEDIAKSILFNSILNFAILSFLSWAWLAKAKGHSCHTRNQLLPKPFTKNKPSKNAKYPSPLRYKKDPLK